MTQNANNFTMTEEPHKYFNGEENELQTNNDGGENLKGTFVQKTVSINERKTLV